MMRRTFIKTAGATALATLASGTGAALSTTPKLNTPPATTDPRWRGFNLLEFFNPQSGPHAFREADFEFMAAHGFNFVRIPMSYWIWSQPDPAKWMTIDERPLKKIDEVVDLGRRYGIHVNLNLHRIPGYCINGREKEPFDLFQGPEADCARALEAACHHWLHFARRYKGIASSRLSFDLINEPPAMHPIEYANVVRALVATIRLVDPARLIVADGIDVGRTPVLELANLGVMQSARGYDPVQVSHYRAAWIPEATRPDKALPTWPLCINDTDLWDKERLRTEMIARWKAAEALGIKVHVGEWGAFNHTPHTVTLAWMEDFLSLWKEADWGWALWNLRGDFGVLDSGRDDVKYEAYHGHRLDRKMLELLRAY